MQELKTCLDADKRSKIISDVVNKVIHRCPLRAFLCLTYTQYQFDWLVFVEEGLQVKSFRDMYFESKYSKNAVGAMVRSRCPVPVNFFFFLFVSH
jgi:hypothetical protein